MQTFGRDLLDKIRNAKLEGENAHALYSPPYRAVLTEEEILKNKPKLAAVNILLYLKNNRWYFPLIIRSKNERDKHSGQISFPGGKKEDSDHNFAHTAKRETSEEVGIDAHYIRIIREISPIYIPPSNFYVHAFVTYTKKNPVFQLQESEAVDLIEFPVESLLNLTMKPETKILNSSRGVEVPVINFNGYEIWGATSMILSEFSLVLKNM
ncbi:8-oxo-dGTP pyrophosphatase MutT, NUDIX family [Halpernia humi]|uniref:8-oxo-dGTP pyrophosphatase MutT, NUDIX family n=1 Tax=Halpernia humi TaxID=493375 RepID=A0A1H6A1H9_9FLAO|nr:CoA pyrophosphatase [Halpernia humi]SEG42260.1 8-oxo-dGTP pyrophosphatase MutT, NUDIX family [Halpernia humi]